MKMMNDNFLYQLREQPDATYARKLRTRLNQLDNETKKNLRLISLPQNLSNRAKQFLLTSLIVIIVLAGTNVSSVRAFVASLLTTIGGQIFELTENYPGDDFPGPEMIIEPKIMPLDSAIASLPFAIELPSNIPGEFVLDENNVQVYVGEDAGQFANIIVLTWKPTAGPYLSLIISDHDLSVQGEIVAPGSVEEINLDGQNTAVLIKGGWDADKKIWNPELRVIRLRWQANGLSYDLHGIEDNIMIDQLKEIALSTID